MRPKVKYQVIYHHQSAYPVSVMRTFFGVSRSGYYDYVKRMNRPEKDAPLAALLRKQQEHCFQTYGYRRMHLWLERQGIHHNPKTVLRVMEKYGLLSEIRRERKWKLRTCRTGFATLPAAGVTTCAVRAENSAQSVSAVPFFV